MTGARHRSSGRRAGNSWVPDWGWVGDSSHITAVGNTGSGNSKVWDQLRRIDRRIHVRVGWTRGGDDSRADHIGHPLRVRDRLAEGVHNRADNRLPLAHTKWHVDVSVVIYL